MPEIILATFGGTRRKTFVATQIFKDMSGDTFLNQLGKFLGQGSQDYRGCLQKYRFKRIFAKPRRRILTLSDFKSQR